MVDVILTMVRSICGTARYEYLSGPITGGAGVRDAYDRAKTNKAATDWNEKAKEANISALLLRANQLREQTGALIIEPGSFEAGALKGSGWGQDEYLDLWRRVIADHVSRVRFMDGWQYSSGCVHEFHCAIELEKLTLNNDGEEISCIDAIHLVEAAIADLEKSRVPSPDNSDRLEHLVSRLNEELKKLRELQESRASC